MMRSYVLGAAVLGDMGTGGAPSLPRDEWRAKGSAAAPAVSSARPLSAGAVAPSKKPNFLEREAFGGVKVWQAALAGLGILAIGTGVVVMAVRK